MVKSTQMVKLAAWVLPNPENAEDTLAGSANKFRAWLEVFDKAHPELRAGTKDLIKHIELFLSSHVPGPSKPVESTPSSPAISPASSGPPIESLQTKRLSLVETDIPLSPQEETLSAPPSTVLPALANEYLPAPRSSLAKPRAIATRLKTPMKAPSAPAHILTNSDGSEDEGEEDNEQKKEEKRALLREARQAKPKAAPRARRTWSRFNVEQDKLTDVERPSESYNEATKKILAKIPQGARRYARGSLKVTLDKDAYKCLGSRRWLSGGVMIALLSLLELPSGVQIFHLDTVTDPKTGLLAEDKLRTIDIDPATRMLYFAHCSDNHWVTIEIRTDIETVGWYCSLGKPYSKTIVDFYCRLVERSLGRTTGQTAGIADEGPDNWIIVDEDCAKQGNNDSSSCGIFVMHNICCLVKSWPPCSKDRVDPERQRWVFACQIDKYVQAHDPVRTPSDSPVLNFADPPSLPNLPDTDLPMGDAMDIGESMDIDESLDIPKPADKDSEVPFSLASPIESLQTERLPSTQTGPPPLPEAKTLTTPTSTILPVPRNESLPADPPLSTAAAKEVDAHDPVPSALSSPSLAPINTPTLTNHPSSTQGERNNAKGKGKLVLEEESRSPADSDSFIRDTMDIDEPLDIGGPLNKDSEAPVSPASAPSPSPMIGRERKDRLVVGFAGKGRGDKRSEATRSDEDMMEVEPVSKRRKESSTATPGPTTASVPTTTDQTPPRATTQGFISINQSSPPPPTRPTVDLVQREAPFAALPLVQVTQPRLQPSSSSSSAHPTIHPQPPLVRRSEVDLAVREDTLRKLSKHVLSAKAHEALEDLLEWYYSNQRAGVDSVLDVNQNAVSVLRMGPSTAFRTTAASLREASRLVHHDLGSGLLAEFMRRYRLAVFAIQYGDRKQALEEHFRLHPHPSKGRPTAVNEALLKETVFSGYHAMIRHSYRGAVWAGLMERFGYSFLALVDLNAPKRLFEESNQRFNVRTLLPQYIIDNHPDIDIASINRSINEIIPQLISGTLVDEKSAMIKQKYIAKLSTPTKENR